MVMHGKIHFARNRGQMSHGAGVQDDVWVSLQKENKLAKSGVTPTIHWMRLCRRTLAASALRGSGRTLKSKSRTNALNYQLVVM